MPTNLFPAILLAGPPHAGKSVLAHQLTTQLKAQHVPHYLLRAAPDGEGNWLLEGDAEHVFPLRLKYKQAFTAEFVEKIKFFIRNRQLPFLVDIGGRPEGNQWEIPGACTHSILLYRTPEQYAEWKQNLARFDLLPVAELHSQLDQPDNIRSTPIVEAAIGGLDRERPVFGRAFEALLERVSGICRYEQAYLEAFHTRHALVRPVVSEYRLAAQIGIALEEETPYWLPKNLPEIQPLLPPKGGCAIYGRGPVWLAVMLAAYMSGETMAVYDTHYGWVQVPQLIQGESTDVKVQFLSTAQPNSLWAEVTLHTPFLEPRPSIALPEFPSSESLVLSGRLPRWLFAALGRSLAPKLSWIGVHEPSQNRVVVTYSRLETPRLGETLPILH